MAKRMGQVMGAPLTALPFPEDSEGTVSLGLEGFSGFSRRQVKTAISLVSRTSFQIRYKCSSKTRESAMDNFRVGVSDRSGREWEQIFSVLKALRFKRR